MKKSQIDLGRAENELYWLGNGVYDRKSKSKKKATQSLRGAVAQLLDVGPQLLDVHGRCACAIAGQMEGKRPGKMVPTPVTSAQTLNHPVVESFKGVVERLKVKVESFKGVVESHKGKVESFKVNDVSFNLTDTRPNLNDTEHVVNDAELFVNEMGLNLTNRQHNLVVALGDDAR